MPSSEATPPDSTQSGGGISPAIKSIVQGLLLFFGTQFVIGKFFGPNSSAPATTSIPTNNDYGTFSTDSPSYLAKSSSTDGQRNSIIPQKILPIWPETSYLDILITVSPTFALNPISETLQERIVLNQTAFHLGDFAEERVIDGSFKLPTEIQNNGTLWGHFYIGLSGEQLDPLARDYKTDRSYHFTWPLTHYLPHKKAKKTKNLLAATNHDEGDEQETETPSDRPIITSHYHPNFTMSFIPDTGIATFPSLHPAMRQYFHLERSGARDETGQNGWYYPVLFVNTFWQLRSQMIPLNSTVDQIPIQIKLNNMKNWKFSIISSIDEGAKQTTRAAAQGSSMPGGGDGSEFEMIKEVILQTNPYLLGTTVIVSILHMIFEMLAFKSDISHYRNKKNNVGISVRSILGNVFMQSVILLYLLDNNENTSWMILFSQGMGILLEFWKITTIVNIRIRPSNNLKKRTKEFDAIAFKYLYMIAVPLLLAYAAYSLTYETHKSWYSFIITTLVGSVYAYGFLMMVPSLYINYRLKSVAHMPARAMTYKFLNTFIDDLFAFTIKMPTLHRLATLRDDLIFFVYLYQSWKYRVDYMRVNEFGQGGDEDQKDSEPKADEALKDSPCANTNAQAGASNASDQIDGIVDDGKAIASGSLKKQGARKRT
ncbi:putative cleft lip and palate associated transmembrane protein 1 [Blumeria hordei DH14]|uniref:Putative cleft lip and palate associated transmembrane protein 1 n=1 Tax=Blumeria graminis f. sp. hordei (strain DH14) TaxID=546991 RepID=N1JK32_BLUG1|nr:putative cleft lip and palate associated transmembrane protein 1 [Blumeria hordei DH14]